MINEVQSQCYFNRTYKKSISKVTTSKSSCKKSQLFDYQQQGIVKSKFFNSLYPISPQMYIKSIRKTMFLFPQCINSQCKSNKNSSEIEKEPIIVEQLWKFAMSVMDKFNLNYETIGLAVCFYFKLTFSLFNIDKRPLYLKKFHISACIHLAAKSIQLQKNIPKPPAFQYFCGQNYTSQDYKQFQIKLIKILDYDLQKATLFTFLNIYLSVGIFYKDEICEIGKQIEEVEKQILQNGLQSMRRGWFIQNECGNPQIEALTIIKNVRKKYYLTQQNQSLSTLFNHENLETKQRKRSSCMSFTHSMGNLFRFGENESFYTQRVNGENVCFDKKQDEKRGHLERKKELSNKNKNKVYLNSGSQILQRKKNLDKSYKKKQSFEEYPYIQTSKFKYVSLKDQNLPKQQQLKLTKQLIKCRSASNISSFINGEIKYYKNNSNLNSDLKSNDQKSQDTSKMIPSLNSIVEDKKQQKLLKGSKSFQNLVKITVQGLKSVKKLQKLSELKQDRIIEKSRERQKSRQKSRMKGLRNEKVENSQKHFNRRNNGKKSLNNKSNSSQKVDVLNQSYYRNK